jgi:hypothetical protein
MKASRWRKSIAFHLGVVQLHNRSDAQNPLERFCPDSKRVLNSVQIWLTGARSGTGYNAHETDSLSGPPALPLSQWRK